MKWQPIEHSRAVQIYDSRSDLVVDTFSLVRLRVAIAIVKKEYRRRPTGQTRATFAAWYLTQLQKLQHQQIPHPLHFELVRCLKDLMAGMSGEQVYAEMRRTRATRAIHKVRYGGRKDFE